MIVTAFSRFLLTSRSSYLRVAVRCIPTATPSGKTKYVNDQMEYIKSVTSSKVTDWQAVRTHILSMPGSFKEKNIDGVLLKILITYKKIDAALSFAEFLENSEDDLSLGVTNGMLGLYYEIAKERQLTDKEKQFILDSYKKLYEKYEVLDSTTCERLLHALCAVDEWSKALKVLDDINLSCKPTHSAYSTVIATLFKLNRKAQALELIENSLQNKRPLKHVAYESWINYVLRKYKEKKTRVKYLEEVCVHISRNCTILPEKTAELLKDTYAALGWNAKYTKIRKQNGQCVYCKSSLECLKLTEDEFKLIQKNVKDRIIVGSDILLKTSPQELQRFLEFVERTAPYDIVLDALNICYAMGKFKADKVGPLIYVVEHFRQQNKKILLIGRKHMLKWPKMNYLLNKTCNFFTDDMSQDDPFFITAAILSGSHTDFVSKDQLRGHRFQMQEELRYLFQRWQWQHQWMVFINKHGAPFIQEPLSVTPCAQKVKDAWHIPFERDEATTVHGHVRDGTPDWTSWLCLQAPVR
ncbi:mitochondrial ribonuclease P catalytic subunit [Pectinophora gossypiella]|nr:mitochondrial ribonuclease P catalytic subunit [Pectinophora gossypiella]